MPSSEPSCSAPTARRLPPPPPPLALAPLPPLAAAGRFLAALPLPLDTSARVTTPPPAAAVGLPRPTAPRADEEAAPRPRPPRLAGAYAGAATATATVMVSMLRSTLEMGESPSRASACGGKPEESVRASAGAPVDSATWLSSALKDASAAMLMVAWPEGRRSRSTSVRGVDMAFL